MPTPTRLDIVAMMTVSLAGLTLAAGAHPPAGTDADDRGGSVGGWEVVAAEVNGRPIDPELVSRLSVAFRQDGSWTVLFKSFPVAEGTSSNDQHANPKTFDVETVGSAAIEPTRYKPKRYKGIYRLEGDSRVLCFVPDGEPRPDAFTAPERSRRTLVTLRRLRSP